MSQYYVLILGKPKFGRIPWVIDFEILVWISKLRGWHPLRSPPIPVSKDAQFSLLLMQKVCRQLSTHVFTHAKVKTPISTLKSQGIVPILILFELIFNALQGQLFRTKIDSLGWKILKFQEFNLGMYYRTLFSMWFCI